ncbi:MAG: acyltransferase [Chitinophagaceae bacterium]|nr:acyltransferase [Chitinophagaceae bacterium]
MRGVAAIIVVAFHLCEPLATSHLTQLVNHGYLAVDFFFLLSGFVIGYAYDDRWNKLTIGGFFRRRIERCFPYHYQWTSAASFLVAIAAIVLFHYIWFTIRWCTSMSPG